MSITLLKGATRIVKGAELDGDAGANADKGRKRACVEREGTFVGEDGARTREGGGVGGCGLETDFDDVWVDQLRRISVHGITDYRMVDLGNVSLARTLDISQRSRFSDSR